MISPPPSLTHSHTLLTPSLARSLKYAGNVSPLEVLTPTVRRPFGNLVLSAPRDGERFLRGRFGRLWREKVRRPHSLPPSLYYSLYH